MIYKRLKDYVKITGGVGVNPAIQGQQEGVFPFFRNSDFSKLGNEECLLVSESNFTEEDIENYSLRTVKKNSIIFPKIGESIRKNHKKFCKQRSVIDNNLAALNVTNRIDREYLFWYFKSIDLASFLIPSTVPVLGISSLKVLEMPRLSRDSQKAIANFLEDSSARINWNVEILRKKISLLEEYKEALVYETVTKGLVKGVPMRNSGIDWIGNVPSAWKINRVKDVATISKGKAVAVTFDECANDMLPCINTDLLRKKNEKIIYQKTGLKIKKNQTLILWDGSNAGEAFFNTSVGFLGSTLGCLSGKLGKFLYYYMKCYEKSLRNSTVGMGIPHVNSQILKCLVVFTPPKSEQENIVNFLDGAVSKADQQIELMIKKIEVLQELSKSLIYEAVNGLYEIDESYYPIKNGMKEFLVPVEEGADFHNGQTENTEYSGELVITEETDLDEIRRMLDEENKNNN